MQSITALIDTMHELEDGTVVTIETDEETYHGVIACTEYTAPEGDEAGHLGIKIDCKDGTAGETLEVRTEASASQKFPRPELYANPSDDTEGDPLGTVADITVEASDT